MFYEPALCAKADDSFCKIHVQFNDNVSPPVILAKPFMDDHCIKRNRFITMSTAGNKYLFLNRSSFFSMEC